MGKYHINPQTGRPMPCNAQEGKCPYGNSMVHFEGPLLAERYSQEMYGKTISDNYKEMLDCLENNFCVDEILAKDKDHGMLITAIELGRQKAYVDVLGYENLTEKEQQFYLESLERTDRISYRYAPYLEDVELSKIDDKAITNMINHEGLISHDELENSWKKANRMSDIDYSQLDIKESKDIIDSTVTSNGRDYPLKNEDIKNIVIGHRRVRNATTNLAWENYKAKVDKNVSFDDFINQEVTVYRCSNGDKIPSNTACIPYSFTKEDAKKMSKGGKGEFVIKRIKIKDTLGSLNTDGQVFLLKDSTDFEI